MVLDVGDGVGAMTAATAMRSPLYSVCAAGGMNDRRIHNNI